MAIAKRTVGVTHGYLPKTKRAAKRSPGVLQRVAATLQQGVFEMTTLLCDEIVSATLDTLQLMDYARYVLHLETRARVTPVVQELEAFVHEHELLGDVSTFAVEQVNALNVRPFKR